MVVFQICDLQNFINAAFYRSICGVENSALGQISLQKWRNDCFCRSPSAMHRQPVKTSFLGNNRLICMSVMKCWPAKIDFYENSRLCFAFALSVQPAKLKILIFSRLTL